MKCCNRLWLVVLTSMGCGTAVVAEPTSVGILPEVAVTAQRADLVLEGQPAGVGTVFTLVPDATVTGQLDQLLVENGVATWDAANSLGLSNGLSLRGFAVSNQGTSQLQASRPFLNGHSDIAWRFARDAVTVQRVDLIGGHDATLLGAGSPAGSVHYTSKSAQGRELATFGAAYNSTGGMRLTGDIEKHFGPIQFRGVFALQRNETKLEGVEDNRVVGLLSVNAPLSVGKLRLDVESHELDMPFPFGTAYTGGKFWLNQSYVDSSRASADRRYQRNEVEWKATLDSGLQAALYWQGAKSSRHETLLGFFAPINARQLSGYYRTLDELNTQLDKGARLSGQAQALGLHHSWTAVLQSHTQTRDFAGPQNINGFQLDVEDPVFPESLSKLVLSPRDALETYSEEGIGISDTMRSGPWEARAGVRYSRFSVDSSSNRNRPKARVAQADTATYSVALGYDLSSTQRSWISQTTSFLPNRGKLADGSYLPPSLGHQMEVGWSYSTLDSEVSLSAFDLQQTKLPGRDLKTPDAFVLIGSNRSQGLELRAKTHTKSGLAWNANVTYLYSRVEDAVSATQGSYLVGIPRAYGAMKVSMPMFELGNLWVAFQASSERPANDTNRIEAPGYVVWNMGFKSPLPNTKGEWGVGVDNALDTSYVRALTGVDNVWQGPRRTARVWLNWPL